MSAALLALGCDGDLRPEATGPPVPPAARFVPGPCDAAVPSGVSVECGTVAVPRRHADPGAGTIAVQVALIRGRDAAPGAGRVAYLAGPPGGSGVASAFYYAGWSLDASLRAFLAERTLVAIDLRGTGGSSPSLRCPGVRVTALPETADRIDPETEAAVRDCKARLEGQGVSAQDYGTAEAAEDVEVVRRALGGTPWDLVGTGYGARVALEVIRRHPAGLSAVVLDSVLPPEVDLLAEEGPSAAQALEVMASRCGRDPGCQAAFPDPLGVLAAMIARLDAEPVEVGTHGSVVRLTGASFLRAALQQLSDPGGAARLPRRLYEAQAGSYEFFAAVLGAPRGEGSMGVHLTVMCAEALPGSSRAAIETRAATLSPSLRGALASRFYPLTCPIWSVSAAPAALREPVRGRLPLLLLSGGHDPLAPAQWAQRVAAGFAGARVIELGDHGHALLRSPCGTRIAAAFLASPATPVDATCPAELQLSAPVSGS